MKNLLGETRLNSKTSFGFENGQKCHFDPKMVIRKNNEYKLMMKFSKIRLADFSEDFVAPILIARRSLFLGLIGRLSFIRIDDGFKYGVIILWYI